MKKPYFLIILGIVLIIAGITNPSVATHRDKLKSKIIQNVQNNVKDNQSGILGMALGGALIDRMVENLVTADNYILFSLTKITWKGESKIVGVGAFGNVFLTQRIDDAFANQSLSE